MHARLGAFLTVELFMVTTCCQGAQTDTTASDKPSIRVGAGAMIRSQSYVGSDSRVYPVPLFTYEGDRLYSRGIAVGYWLFKLDGLSIGPTIQPRFDGYEEDDSSELGGMHDRDWSVDGGVAVNWVTGVGLFAVSGVTDLFGRHDGQELDFSYTVLFKKAEFTFIPSVGVRYKSDNLVDYYYGVEGDEVRFDARVSRPAYEADDALDPYLRLVVRRKITERWSLLGAVQYEWLDNEITDSPIVDDNYEASLLLGVLYSW